MTHKALEAYFHTIVKQPTQKEPEMNFLKLSMWFTEQLENFKKLWTKPTAFVQENDPVSYEDGYWVFEMYTPEWENEFGETVKPVHTSFNALHEGTWMEVLDRVLDAMEAHYGYNIKEQVYYSVNFPLNNPEFAGHGRCLNDERLQQILLAFPELYEARPWSNSPTEEVMFK